VYDARHLEQLKVVTDLRDRGLNLHTIRDLVSTQEPTDAVRTWLGIDATLRAPWSQDRPRTLTHRELVDIVGDAADTRPGLIGDLADSGYIERDGESWTVTSPALLESALKLQRAGIDVDVSARMRDLLRRRLAKAVDDTVELLVERAGAGFTGDATPEQIGTALDALRPVAAEVLGVILAQEVDRALDDLLQTGPRSVSRRRVEGPHRQRRRAASSASPRTRT
jgi:DNA-binding transcriptional MerR regulator